MFDYLKIYKATNKINISLFEKKKSFKLFSMKFSILVIIIIIMNQWWWFLLRFINFDSMIFSCNNSFSNKFKKIKLEFSIFVV